ncbi:MAG TPA: oligoendopeptidase F [candidate division Zixibacteria bacterium]|nr:oligoendopeptidase F [candidate division Zixibacteria bacterium]
MQKISTSWNLSDLYESFESEKFQQEFAEIISKCEAFREKFSGKIAEIAQEIANIKACIEEYESIVNIEQSLYSYPALKFNADTRDKEAVEWQQKTQQVVSAASNSLIFFSLELQALPREDIQRLINAPELAPYRHYFENLLKLKPHTLSEEVEQVLNEMSLAGVSAFVQLREQHLGAQEFEPVTTPEGKTAETEPEISALLFHPDAETRLSAYRSVRKVYEEHNLLYGIVLQKIALHYKLVSNRRNFKSTLEAQLLGDEVPESVYRNVMDVTREGFGLFQDYYRYKADELGEKIRICDLYAPFDQVQVLKELPETVEMIYEAMSLVDSEFEGIVRGFFEGEYVDSAVRKGKRGGAFCWGIWGYHPYILQSYTGTPDSWFTLAHELGHGIHGVLTNRAQRLLGADPPMVLAEIASTFNELLLLDYLLERETDEALKKSLITKQIEDSLNLLFRQTTISRLEEDIHNKTAEGAFDSDWVNERWMNWYQTLGGDAVEILPEHRFDWARIGHIFFKPFYCYNYCLSHMVSLACYARFKDEGKAFVPKFKKLLSLGGSKDPKSALQSVGVDPTDPQVMQSAIDHTRGLLDKLIELK